MSGPASMDPAAPLQTLLSAAAAPRDEMSERILNGVLRQIEDFGVRRFTVDDVAKRLGISRVTIYRHFEKKSDLLQAALLHELGQVQKEIAERVEQCETLEERLIEGFVSSVLILRGHRLLNRMLHTEPELILPVLTVGGSPVLVASRYFISGFARRESEHGGVAIDEELLEVLSEMLARAVLSFVLTPQSLVELDSPDQARLFAKRYLAPVLRLMSGFEPKPSISQGGVVR